jgi:hypothetical protein
VWRIDISGRDISVGDIYDVVIRVGQTRDSGDLDEISGRQGRRNEVDTHYGASRNRLWHGLDEQLETEQVL